MVGEAMIVMSVFGFFGRCWLWFDEDYFSG